MRRFSLQFKLEQQKPHPHTHNTVYVINTHIFILISSASSYRLTTDIIEMKYYKTHHKFMLFQKTLLLSKWPHSVAVVSAICLTVRERPV